MGQNVSLSLDMFRPYQAQIMVLTFSQYLFGKTVLVCVQNMVLFDRKQQIQWTYHIFMKVKKTWAARKSHFQAVPRRDLCSEAQS